MAKKTAVNFNEKDLSKGQLRKLKALRKSLGADIADKAFAQWLAQLPSDDGAAVDPTAELVAEAVWQLVQKKKLNLPRGGYLVRRGRGRVIVEPAGDR